MGVSDTILDGLLVLGLVYIVAFIWMNATPNLLVGAVGLVAWVLLVIFYVLSVLAVLWQTWTRPRSLLARVLWTVGVLLITPLAVLAFLLFGRSPSR